VGGCAVCRIGLVSIVRRDWDGLAVESGRLLVCRIGLVSIETRDWIGR